MNPKEVRTDKVAEKILKSLEARRFEAYYCKTTEEAIEKALSLIPEGNSVGWGGSDTIRAMGLVKAVYDAGKYTIIDRDTAKDMQERDEMHRQTLTCDTFLASANALSEDGQLVNVDGNGNRIAAISFGPKSVIFIIGINKVVKTHEDAVARARTIAAPINTQRFGNVQPCFVEGSCADCVSTTSCTYVHTTRASAPPKRIKIILVGENLGY